HIGEEQREAEGDGVDGRGERFRERGASRARTTHADERRVELYCFVFITRAANHCGSNRPCPHASPLLARCRCCRTYASTDDKQCLSWTPPASLPSPQHELRRARGSPLQHPDLRNGHDFVQRGHRRVHVTLT